MPAARLCLPQTTHHIFSAICPPLEEALKKAGLHTMEHHVNKRQQRMVLGLHVHKTHLDALHGGEQAVWGFPQGGSLVGSEEKADKAC